MLSLQRYASLPAQALVIAVFRDLGNSVRHLLPLLVSGRGMNTLELMNELYRAVYDNIMMSTTPQSALSAFQTARRFWLFVLTLLTSVGALNAQLLAVVVEPFDPSTLNPAWSTTADAEEYQTFRIYAEFASPLDKLIEITAQPNFNASTQTFTDCLITYFHSTTYWYNEPNVGAPLGSGINPLFFPIVPAVVGDSWLTIGMVDASTPIGGQVLTIGANLNPSFHAQPGVNLTYTDGSVFGLPTLPNVVAGNYPDNRVPIAQLTTNGEWSFGVNLSVQIGGVLGTPITIYTYDDCVVPANQNQGITYISAPEMGLQGPTIVANAELTEDNACGEDAEAEICVNIALGASPYDIVITPLGGGGSVVNDTVSSTGIYCYTGFGCVAGNGNYDVTVTDVNGFTYNTIIEVSCPSSIQLSTVVTEVQCAGLDNGEIVVNVTGGTGTVTIDADILGFNGFSGTSPFSTTITNVPAGTYTITADDINECEVFTTVTLQEPPALVVDFTFVDMLCAGACTGQVTFSAEGGTPPYSLEVTNQAGTSQNVNALCAGVYTAIVSDLNGCSFSEAITINEPEPIIFAVEPTNVSCNGAGDGQLCVTNTQGGTGTITWQIAAPAGAATAYGTQTCFTGLVPGSYTMNFQDEAGCIVSQSSLNIVEPAPLSVIATPTNVSCFGDGDGSVTVNFEGGTGAVSMVSPQILLLPATLEGLDPGTYEIVIQDETGCFSSTVVSITEPNPLSVAVAGVVDISCGGTCNGVVELIIEGGTGNVSILMNGVPSGTTNLCAGDYEVTVVDANGCTASDFFDIVEPDPIAFLINVNNVTCTGMNDGSVSIFPTGGVGQVTWNIVENVDPNNLFEGTYTIVGQDATGCVADSAFTVGANLVTDMEITTFSSPVTCWNENDGTATAAVTGGALPISYQWNDQLNQTTATAVGLSEDVYAVTVVDAIGCTLSELVQVEPTVGCFFIATVLTPNGDGFNDDWVIGGLEYFPNSMVQVYNRWGQLLFESRGYNTRWDGTWNGRRVPIADYYFVITFDVAKEPITGTVTVKY